MPQGYDGQRWHPPTQAAGWQPPPRRNPREMPPGVPEQFGPAAMPRQDPRSMPRYYQPPPSSHDGGRPRPAGRDAGPRWTYQQPQQPALAQEHSPRYQAVASQGPARARPKSATHRRISAHQLPRYPRFPRLFPRSRRSSSVFRMVYLGTHPVALAMSLTVSCMVMAVWSFVAMIVVTLWLCQCGIVAIQRASQG